ncbi:MAG: DUF5343 domain-containing protein [Ignavibacteriae bacterium]|nr:DUF5343 domain-containing protein [Ignavibacteriota bacterium]
MTDSYPYMVANGKISQILDKVRKASEPPKFTYKFLTQIGFSSTNDRAIIPLLKRLDFLNEDGTPTPYYKELRDSTKFRIILGQKIKELYSDLYSINTNIHEAEEDEIKGAISRVTGKDETTVNRFYATYKTLTDIAEFESHTEIELAKIKIEQVAVDNIEEKKLIETTHKKTGVSEFHYNIQIHLPATTDISVYNSIFRSIKDNLM